MLEAVRQAQLHLTLRHGIALDLEHASARTEQAPATLDERDIAPRLDAHRDALAKRRLVADAQVQRWPHFAAVAARSGLEQRGAKPTNDVRTPADRAAEEVCAAKVEVHHLHRQRSGDRAGERIDDRRLVEPETGALIRHVELQLAAAVQVLVVADRPSAGSVEA